MNEYEIITDASADIAAGAREKYKIQVIPMLYRMNGEDKISDGAESDEERQAFYEAERRGEEVKSTQINPAAYEEKFEPYLKSGKDILYLCLSGGLSQTYASSVAAAEALKKSYPERKIACIDSLAATAGLGLLAERAAKNRERGLTLEENAAEIESAKKSVCHWFTVNDLDFLKRGGRVPASLAALGKILHIKPVLRIGEDGKLVSIGKKIGLKSALNELVSLYSAHSEKAAGEEMRIVHCDCRLFAETVETAILKINPSAKTEICAMSPIIGVHVGYDVVGVVHFGKRA